MAFKCSADNVVKFQEMGWQNLYYTLAWCSGMYISWFGSHAFFRFENGKLNTASWWKGYPNHPLYAEHKLYYLLQLAFWIHMVFVTVRSAHCVPAARLLHRLRHCVAADARAAH